MSRLISTLLFLTILSGCSPRSQIVNPKLVLDLPPETLLQDRPKPSTPIETTADLVNGVIARDAVIDASNADKQGLRDWRDLRKTAISP